MPNGAHGHFLLGRIARLTNRRSKAIAHFEKCLTLNPMMWTAFEALCSLGSSSSGLLVCNLRCLAVCCINRAAFRAPPELTSHDIPVLLVLNLMA